jgi:hypothetical protein
MSGVALFVMAVLAFADEEKVPLDKVPKVVLDAAKKRFPNAEAIEASKETEDGKTVYEIELRENGKKLDVTLTADGTIILIERQIDAKDLPKAVVEAIDKKYPKATFKIIEEVIKVKDGKETLDLYEALLVTADKMKVEVKVAPDGKITGEEKPEKKEEKKPMSR